jgi:hypothetical protein
MLLNDAILAGLEFLNGVDEDLTPAERMNFAIQYANLRLMTMDHITKDDTIQEYMMPKKTVAASMGVSLDSVIRELERQEKEDSNSWKNGSGQDDPS